MALFWVRFVDILLFCVRYYFDYLGWGLLFGVSAVCVCGGLFAGCTAGVARLIWIAYMFGFCLVVYILD